MLCQHVRKHMCGTELSCKPGRVAMHSRWLRLPWCDACKTWLMLQPVCLQYVTQAVLWHMSGSCNHHRIKNSPLKCLDNRTLPA